MAQPPAASTVTLDDLRLDKTAAMITSGAGGRMSARTAPTRPSTRNTAYHSYRLGMNGGQTVTRQVARVIWLDDNQALILQAGLGNGITPAAVEAREKQEAIYHALKVVAGETAANPYPAHRPVIAENGGAGVTGWLNTWNNAFGIPQPDGSLVTNVVLGVEISMDIGRTDHTGALVAVTTNTEDRMLFVTVKFGATDALTTLAVVELAAGTTNPAGALEALRLAAVKSIILDDVAADRGDNFNATDYNALSNREMRWNDNDCNTRQPLSRYTPKLSLYTTAMLAGLNLKAVGMIPILAFTRAYGVSVGLLPDASSAHNAEYQFTDQLCEDDELNLVLAAHPTGEAGQKYLRACLSLIGMFGFLHLANDHTYQQSNAPLIRKAKVAVEACRTTMEEATVKLLSGDAVLGTAVRTTQHPFGLSSTWGVFRDGQELAIIAEPLVIRSAVVPPQLQRLGIANSEISGMLALPVGDMIKRKFGAQMTDLANLQNTVIPDATKYSSLYRHYGHTTQSVLTAAQKASIEALLPICCAFSEVFGVDAAGNKVGAALSQVYENVKRDQYALVEMYIQAFDAYREKGGDLEKLLGLSTTGTAPAAAAPAASSNTTP